jgi:hypothetical protein
MSNAFLTTMLTSNITIIIPPVARIVQKSWENQADDDDDIGIANKTVSQCTLPAISLAPPELSYNISHMLNKTSTSTKKLYIF